MSRHAGPYVPATDVFAPDPLFPRWPGRHAAFESSAWEPLGMMLTPKSAAQHVNAAPDFPMDAERAKWERYER